MTYLKGSSTEPQSRPSSRCSSLIAIVSLTAGWLAGCQPPERGPRVAPAAVESAPAASAPPEPAPIEPAAPVSEAAEPAPALDPAALAAEIEAAEAAWAAALANRDTAALDRLLAEEFTITGVGSTADDPIGSKAEWMANAQLYPWPPHQVLQPRVVAVTPDVAVIKCLWRGLYPPESLTPQGGELTFLITDVWVRRDGRWQVASRHSSLPAAG